jgi:hypothetical protein
MNHNTSVKKGIRPMHRPKSLQSAKSRILLGGLGCLLAALGLTMSKPVRTQAQGTPVPLVINTATPTEVLFVTATPSRTPTQSISSLRVEAKSEANVRASASIDAQVYAKVLPGQFFPVVGRFGRWLQIRYERSPSGFAWVYDEVVNISGGDPNSIPNIDPNAVPTNDVAAAAAQNTANFLTGTPGAPETATALQASATGAFAAVAVNADSNANEPKVTFTYPPPFAEATLPPRSNPAVGGGAMPPIVPIMGLGVLGLFGLFIGTLRSGKR